MKKKIVRILAVISALTILFASLPLSGNAATTYIISWIQGGVKKEVTIAEGQDPPALAGRVYWQNDGGKYWLCLDGFFGRTIKATGSINIRVISDSSLTGVTMVSGLNNYAATVLTTGGSSCTITVDCKDDSTLTVNAAYEAGEGKRYIAGFLCSEVSLIGGNLNVNVTNSANGPACAVAGRLTVGNKANFTAESTVEYTGEQVVSEYACVAGAVYLTGTGTTRLTMNCGKYTGYAASGNVAFAPTYKGNAFFTNSTAGKAALKNAPIFESGKNNYTIRGTYNAAYYAVLSFVDEPIDENGVRGDMDGDGFVTVADARIVLRIAIGLE